MKFGAHISSAAPFSEAINRAREIGADCMQIFLNAPQRWSPIKISEEQMERFIELNHKPHPNPLPVSSTGQALEKEREQQIVLPRSPRRQRAGVRGKIIDPIISHSIYLISLSGNNPFYYEASKKSLIDELEKGKKLGLLGVNTHLGSSKEKTFDAIKENVAKAIEDILAAVPDGPDFIIENSAGAGNVIGDQIEEIAEIINSVKSPRLKVLIDTAHAFESGYALHEKAGLEEFIEKFDKLVGLEKLVGLHLNDSTTPFNSKRDRHADIGEGEIGLEAIERIVNHPKLKDLFGIIETPSLKGKGGVDNLAILRSLTQ